ncbi:hypothetical protein [Polyangium sp. 6x1]|uniref:hypothetical protein n=1 Tax=Polyangium sp. 6x1 TaxID=3042689 RepID=UPI0024822938|nr:hypothetical protein [Polyangium sp. 6x1]MDI1451073.1 hypothetical protein [Polyangium sp. 6x1]
MSNCPPDADFDGISDDVEGKEQGVDTDGDGTPDYLDTDSDNDSLPDALEGQTASVGCAHPQNSDGTAPPDFRDTDSDDNGLPDALEIYPDQTPYDPQKPAPNPADTDGDGVPDYADPDNDDDSLPDTVELSMGVAVNTDGDVLPDLSDADSDNDTIGDAFEGLADPDGDGVPAFRDSDSDNDGLSDMCEAGPLHMVADPPPDADSDGKYDFLDLDADADGILDKDEDINLNCMLDPFETDRTKADTDGDGTSDLIERELGSDPRDPFVTPGTLGKFYFVLPYLGAPSPAENIVPLRTNLNQGDVAFLVDTTATMGGEIQNLKSNLGAIIAKLKASIPDLAVGIAGFDDFPTGTYGTAGVDQPFYVAGSTGYVSTTLADNLAAVLSLNVHDGGDNPESHIAAMYRALTDAYLLWPGGQLTPAGAPSGRYGTLRFRDGALPILVPITDAPFHNGRRSIDASNLHDAYDFNGLPPFPTPTVDTLITTMKQRGARLIGISSSNGVRMGGDPYEDLAYIADQTSSLVPPSAFGGMQCGTGPNGAFIVPDGPANPDNPGGTCRLIFDISTDGSGLNDLTLDNGIKALLKSIRFDIRALATANIADPIDAVDTFITQISVNASGGDDAAQPGVPCFSLNAVQQLKDAWSGAKGLVKAQDGVNETALGIVPGQKICFKIVPTPNTTIPQNATAQIFKATLTVKAQNGISPSELLLGAPKEILFLVPPAPQ